MTYPNAYRGMKKIFAAEIIAIAIAVLGVVTAILSVLPAAKEENSPLILVLGVFALILGIAGIVSFIIQLIGIIQCSRDEGGFRAALFLIILSIVLSLLSTILDSLKVDWGMGKPIVESLGNVATLIATVFIFLGIGSLAISLRNEAMARRARFLAFVTIGLYALSIILTIIPRLIPNPNEGAVAVLNALLVTGAVLEVIVYIITVIFFGRAVKMLKN